MDAGKLTMKGKDDKTHDHDIKDAKIIGADGKPAKVEDLKADTAIKVTLDDKGVVTMIEIVKK